MSRKRSRQAARTSSTPSAVDRQRAPVNRARVSEAQTRPPRLGLIAALAIGVVAVAAVAWQLLDRSESPPGPAGLPGPLGGPEIAQDVNTLVGKLSPAFTLADSEGQRYTVAPGQGRPIVLVSHMGIT